MNEPVTRSPSGGVGVHASGENGVPQSTPPRFLTVFDIADLLGCHEETVRRAYTCGQLRRRRLGVRSCRFDPADVQDWIPGGAPTRMPGERHRPKRR